MPAGSTRQLLLASLALMLLTPIGSAPSASAADGAACPPGAACDWLVVVDSEGRFHLGPLARPSVASFFYGEGGDVPLMGDWNCDGTATPGAYRLSNGFLYLRNSNTQGVAEVAYFFGDPGDLPLAGDFNGDGCDTVSVYRPSEGALYVRNSLGTGPADYSYFFGVPGDDPFVGDFDGDGVDTVGLYRRSTGLVYFRNSHTSGAAHFAFYYGDPGDRLLVGDWNGNGVDTLAVHRPSTGMLYVKLSNGHGPADLTVFVGSAITPVAARRPAGPARPPTPTTTTTTSSTTTSSTTTTTTTLAPPGAIAVSPGDDLQGLVDQHPEGTAFLIRSGVHRLQQVRPKDGNVFRGEPGAMLSGARLLTDFVREGSLWMAEVDHQPGQVHGECIPDYQGCRYPEGLFLDDRMLWQVTSKSEVGQGRWFFDYQAGRVYLADDPVGMKVELSVTRHAFYGAARDVIVEGLIVEKYANPAQYGAIQGHENNWQPSRGWVVSGNEVRWNHGVGVRIGHGMRVLGNFVHHNGQLGIGGSGADVVVEGNEIAHNNTAGFTWQWEAGGTKFAFTSDLAVRGNHSHHNGGPGLWTDIDNIRTLYEENLVTDNEGMGIFHEISYQAVIRHNRVERNGLPNPIWVDGAGILVSGSPDVEIYGNYVAGNGDGIAAKQTPRGSGRYGPYEVRNLLVRDNYVVMDQGHTGIVENVGDQAVFEEWNNRFVGNRYRLIGERKFYQWGGASRSTEAWIELGHDVDGVWD